MNIETSRSVAETSDGSPVPTLGGFSPTSSCSQESTVGQQQHICERSPQNTRERRISPLKTRLHMACQSSLSPTTSEAASESPNAQLSDFSETWPSTSEFRQRYTGTIGRIHQRNDEYRRLFGLPEAEYIIDDWTCAFRSKQGILLQGRLFSFVNFICFYSNVFGFCKKLVMPARDIMSITKRKNIGVIPNSIEILCRGKSLFFTSFLSRDEAFCILQEQWGHRSDHPRLAFESEPMQNKLFHNSFAEATTPTPLMHTPSSPSQWLSESDVEGPENPTRPSYAPLPALKQEKEGSGDSACLAGERSCGISRVVAFSESESTESEVEVANFRGLNRSADDEERVQPSSNSPQVVWDPLPESAPLLDGSFKPLLTAELPCTPFNFFVIFLDDNSCFWKDHLVKRGDKKIHFDKWVRDKSLGNLRNVRFVSPVKSSFGPAKTRCLQSQRYTVYNEGNHLTLDTSQMMLDIPYGDQFTIEMRWDITQMGPEACCLKIAIQTCFSRKTMFRGTIERTVMTEALEGFSAWVAQAKDLLSAPPPVVNDSMLFSSMDSHHLSSGNVKQLKSNNMAADCAIRPAEGQKFPSSETSASKNVQLGVDDSHYRTTNPQMWLKPEMWAVLMMLFFLMALSIFTFIIILQGHIRNGEDRERFLQMQQQVLEVHMHMADVLRALTTTSDKLTAAMQALQQGTYDGNLSRLDNGHICRSQQ